MGKGGRPRIEINKDNFENLCGLACTLEEIAGFFKCSMDTIERWCKRTYDLGFAEIYKKYSTRGKISLRRNQFALSKTNATMAVWLGKQLLGQRDKYETEAGNERQENETVGSFLEALSQRKVKGLDDVTIVGDDNDD